MPMNLRGRFAMPRSKKPWFTTFASPLLRGPWNLARSTPKGFGKGTKLEHGSVGKPSVIALRALKVPERIVYDLPFNQIFLRLLPVQMPRATMEIGGRTP